MAYQTDVSVIVAVLFISCFWYWYQYQFGSVYRPFCFSPDVDAYPVQEFESTLSRCLPQFCWNSITSWWLSIFFNFLTASRISSISGSGSSSVFLERNLLPCLGLSGFLYISSVCSTTLSRLVVCLWGLYYLHLSYSFVFLFSSQLVPLLSGILH